MQMDNHLSASTRQSNSQGGRSRLYYHPDSMPRDILVM